MATDISVNDLPSKKFSKIWEDGICYNEVNDIIRYNKGQVEAFTWKGNVQKNFSNHLGKLKAEIKENTLEKRCRDLYYLIYGILYQLKNLKDYYTIYIGIKDTIKNHINSAFMNAAITDTGYANCLVVANKEEDYEHDTIKNKKYIDDLCEDFIYIEKNINQINRSLECNGIKKYFEGEISKIKPLYETDTQKYKKILQYYKQDNFDNLINIIEKIKCNAVEDFRETRDIENEETEVDFLPLHIFISSILSLFGFLLIFFFLYQATPFRSWFDRKIRKKIIFANNANDDVSHKILEDSCEYPKTNSYSDEYHVLYNFVADN
ncbi:PIR Superfamily Protein [Plasmodium ovale curtisi]|uniref:PIR Superfamily Protein n=1 Tax=Plasmodium ovale curtisi TaxID=864141 RepID=A0A1A8X6F2_PLAOA|nr:PIR Superfamily Protein [Plasmodium ovale curtisi]SBT00839.1 PIR Superfamily Protein [Plasmodium ovale curtisi]